jgi:hypothetical protein
MRFWRFYIAASSMGEGLSAWAAQALPNSAQMAPSAASLPLERWLAGILGQHRPTAAKGHSRINVGGCAPKFLGWRAEPESVGTTAARNSGRAALILPIRLLEKYYVDAPDHDWPGRFDEPRRINQIAPNDLPAGMIVMRLHRPRANAALRFESQFRRGIEPPSER